MFAVALAFFAGLLLRRSIADRSIPLFGADLIFCRKIKSFDRTDLNGNKSTFVTTLICSPSNQFSQMI